MHQTQDLCIVGHNVEEMLYQKRKRQIWLAHECNVTPSHINQIIKGKTKPSLQVLKAMADALEVTTDEIINENYLGEGNILHGKMD